MGSKLSEFVIEMYPAYTDTNAYRLQRRVSRISLAPGKRRCRVLMRRDAVLLKHKKSRLRTTCACLVVASEQESCCDSMPSSP